MEKRTTSKARAKIQMTHHRRTSDTIFSTHGGKVTEAGSKDNDLTPQWQWGVNGGLIISVLICGTLSTAAYEQLNVRDRGCGHLITFCEYMLVLVLNGSGLFQKRQAPIWTHLIVLAGFLGYSLLCNVALAMALPVTILLIMKNGNMVADVVVGTVALGKRYSLLQIMSVLSVTAGISIAALAAKTTREGMSTQVAEAAEVVGTVEAHNDDNNNAGDDEVAAISFAVGAGCILLALVLRAVAGAAQESVLHRTKGAAGQELLLWRAFLGMPILLALQWRAIWDHGQSWSTLGAQVEVGSVTVPVLWMLMAMNLLFDYLTKVTVGELIFRTSSLTTSLVLILMRFICIVVSTVIVNAPPYPPWWMWVGCAAVVFGAASYVMLALEKKKEQARKED